MEFKTQIVDVGEEKDPIYFLKKVFDTLKTEGEPIDYELSEVYERDEKLIILKVKNRTIATVLHTRTAFNFIEVIETNYTENNIL